MPFGKVRLEPGQSCIRLKKRLQNSYLLASPRRILRPKACAIEGQKLDECRLMQWPDHM